MQKSTDDHDHHDRSHRPLHSEEQGIKAHLEEVLAYTSSRAKLYGGMITNWAFEDRFYIGDRLPPSASPQVRHQCELVNEEFYSQSSHTPVTPDSARHFLESHIRWSRSHSVTPH